MGASQAIVAGVSLNRFVQMFLAHHYDEVDDPPAHVWAILKAHGQIMRRDGETLDTDEANLAELRRLHAIFVDQQLPVLRRLGIA